MTQETTIAKDAAESKAAGVAAPMGKPVEALNEAVTSENLLHVEPSNRQKTGGEHLFDATTYGGLALVGNEMTATWIVEQKTKQNLIGQAYREGDSFFKNLGKPGTLPYLQNRFNYISFAIIGGFVMVPFIKWLEDNKGRCVRFADRIFYGERANTPEIAKKHEEMDNAPKQSWGSLGKGRLLTVAAAYTVDATINWKDGLLARALKDTRFKNYASAEHLSNHASEWLNNKIAPMRNLSPEKALVQKGFINNLVGLTTLSAMLTILFYASSKLFAKKRDEKLERRHLPTYDGTNRDTNELESPELTPEQLAQEAITKAKESSKSPEVPQPKVKHVAHEQTVAAAPELAAAGV